LNYLRIIILKDVKSKEDFIGFAKRYSVFADNKVFLRSLFEMMGFDDFPKKHSLLTKMLKKGTLRKLLPNIMLVD
jgi:hypothetical protein